MNIPGFIRIFCLRGTAFLFMLTGLQQFCVAAELCDIELHDPEPHILSLGFDPLGEDCQLSAQPDQRPGTALGLLALSEDPTAITLQFSLNLAQLNMERGAKFTLLSLAQRFEADAPAKFGLLSLGLNRLRAGSGLDDRLYVEIVWPITGPGAVSRIMLPDDLFVLDIELQWDQIQAADAVVGLWIDGQLYLPNGRLKRQAPRYVLLGLLDRSETAAVAGEFVISQFQLFSD